MTKDDNYTNVLLEDIRSQMQAVLEIVGENQKTLQDVPKRNEFNKLKSDVVVIKEAVKQTNKDVQRLDRRVTILESKLSR